MTPDDGPSDPSVLNTTVLSNFAYVDRITLLAGLSGVCTVPTVRGELDDGVGDHPYLRSALDSLGDAIPVATIPDPVANREAVDS